MNARSENFRERACELRRIAEYVSEATREDLLKLAREYEALAEKTAVREKAST